MPHGVRTPQIKVEEVKSLYPFYDDVSALSRAVGLPRETVRDLLDKPEKFTEFRQRQKRDLIMRFTRKIFEFLPFLDPEKARSQTELAIVIGTLTDKTALLGGETRFSAQTVNIGDNRKIEIKIAPSAKSLLERKRP